MEDLISIIIRRLGTLALDMFLWGIALLPLAFVALIVIVMVRMILRR